MNEKRPAHPARSTLPAASIVTILAAAAATLSVPVEAPAQTSTTAPAQVPSTRFANRPPADTSPASLQKVAQLGKRDRRVHDPSTIVKCKDEYWFFSTGRGVLSHHSKDLKTWEAGPPVVPERPEWIAQAVPAARGNSFWAPDVIHQGDRYMLYYSVSTFGKNTSAIGLVTSPTLDPDDPAYKWTDHGPIVQSKQSDDFNTIDPCVTVDADGKMWLAFGSFWSGIKMVELDPATGKRIAPDSPMYSLAHYSSIEAPFIHRSGEYYYLFVNWGMCCRGVNSTYNIRVGRSRTITGPYLDKDGKDMLKGGGTLLLETDGPFVGPGHAGIVNEGGREWLSMHFYDATERGASMLAIRPLTWDPDGWPRVADAPVASRVP
jgi:arabinan endo-1,5-alpha-L-arabinosidase